MTGIDFEQERENVSEAVKTCDGKKRRIPDSQNSQSAEISASLGTLQLLEVRDQFYFT